MLQIHRAERADGLVAALRDVLTEPLPDPFATEVVAVPTRGMERWLTQRMASAFGICANVDFPFPGRVVGDAVAAASGIDSDADPWRPERAVWPLVDVVRDAMGDPWLAALAGHLGHGGDPTKTSRRLPVLRHVADLFDRYAIHRPDIVLGWGEGAGEGDRRDPSVAARGDAAGAERWQPELWRRLRARIGIPSPAERLAAACARLREDPAAVDLPARVSLFGFTRLPAGHLKVLDALATHRDVHLFLLHPSPALWERVAGSPPVVNRAADPTADLATHPLLASWGRDAREMQLVLQHADASEQRDHHHPVDPPPPTLLGRIQADVRADRPPKPERVTPGDRSLQVHACHGRARQVEVMRDAILHALQDDPGLEPRDVIVMCPDIEAFAPLIHATFGAGETATDPDDDELLSPELRPPDLRVRLADRALRQTNPVLGVISQLLELADGRVTASEVLALADRTPVRRRFRLDDEDLERLQGWIADGAIRWGLDAEHRGAYRLADIDEGTWRFGLDRLLLGVAMSEDGRRRFAGVLPIDDVESGAIDRAGRVTELVARLQDALDRLDTPQPMADWAVALAGAARALTATTDRDAWQLAELERLLDEAVEESGGADTPVELAEVRALLADRLQGRPTRANFRTGHLTICTLVPMRSVPHRVVGLLGLDDGAFPRPAPRDGDDLMLDAPRIGERDPRSEDRQLLLDALLAAGDRLIVTYTGNDERTNAPRPPAVPVGELLDVVEATGGEGAADRVLTRHPLQPFDPRNFTAGTLAPGTPWGFDHVALDGARALRSQTEQPRPFLATPLPPRDPTLVEVADLVAFVEHPCRAFLRQRLGLGVRDDGDEVADELPVELDGLERWGVGDRLLEALLDGVDRREAGMAEQARGLLPPGHLGHPVIQDIFPMAEAIAQEALAAGREARSVDVRTELADGRRLGGTIAGVCGDVLRTPTYSRLAGKHRLAAWVRLLALSAAQPERPWQAVTIGRGDRDRVRVARIAPLAPDPAGRRAAALAELATLLDLYDRGMAEPAPLYCATSAAWATGGPDAEKDAHDAWTTSYPYTYSREDRDREHELVLGGVVDFEDLLEDPLRADEEGPDWDPAEVTRFGRWARRLWAGLLAREVLE